MEQAQPIHAHSVVSLHKVFHNERTGMPEQGAVIHTLNNKQTQNIHFKTRAFTAQNGHTLSFSLQQDTSE